MRLRRGTSRPTCARRRAVVEQAHVAQLETLHTNAQTALLLGPGPLGMERTMRAFRTKMADWRPGRGA